MQHETFAQFLARRGRERALYPETSVVDSAKDLVGIDRIRAQEGRPLTTLGQAIQRQYARTLQDGPTGVFSVARYRPQGTPPNPEDGDERPPTPAPTPSLFNRIVSATRDVAGEALSSSMIGKQYHALEQASAGTLGLFAGENPVDSLKKAYAGIENPELASTYQRDVGFVRLLPDEDVIGEFSPRDLAGGIAGLALDATNLIGGTGAAPDVIRVGGKAISKAGAIADEAAQAAGRGALRVGFGQPATDSTLAARILPDVSSGARRLLGATDEEVDEGVRLVGPPQSARDLLGLQPVEVGLSPSQRLTAVFSRTPTDAIATPLFTQRRSAQPVIAAQAARAQQITRTLVANAFDTDATGRIGSLAGIDPTLPGAPTIRDVAARYPRFASHLTPAQREALIAVRDELGPWHEALVASRISLDEARPDVLAGGGIYVPRGDPKPLKGRTRGQRVPEFGSEAEAIESGFRFAPVDEAVADYIKQAGTRVVDAHVANVLTKARTADGTPLGQTPKVRLLDANPNLAKKFDELKKQIASLRASGATLSRRQDEALTAFTLDPSVDDIDQVRAVFDEGFVLTSRVIDSDQLPAATVLSDRIQRVTELVQRDAQGYALNNQANTARLEEIGRLQAFEDLRRILDASGDDFDVALKNLEAETRRLSDSVQARGEASVRARMGNAERRATRKRGWSGYGDVEEGGEMLSLRTRADTLDEILSSTGLEYRTAQMSVDAASERAFERALRRLADQLHVEIKQGPRAGMDVATNKAAVAAVKRELDALRPDYLDALEKARRVPQGQGAIRGSMQNALAGHSFPEELANAANAILEQEGRTAGKYSGIVKTVEALNQLSRASSATLDNSGPAIQGLLGMADDQRAYAQALKANIKALVGPDSDRVVGAFLRDFDKKAVKEGGLTSSQWAAQGLQFGGGSHEFAFPTKGVSGLIQRVPGVQRTNRAFGALGDTLRPAWAHDMLTEEIAKGRTAREIIDSGDARRIAAFANGATGYSAKRFGGDVGEMLLFAPRFLQARLETAARAARGSVPARGALSHVVPGLSPEAALQDRLARRTIIKTIAYATTLTVGANAALGEETDFRPLIKQGGKWGPNSNFMRIRAGGRDWSLLGTWDSLARLLILTGGGVAQGKASMIMEAARGLTTGPVGAAWNLIAGTDAIGKPTRDSKAQLVATVAEAFAPFSAGSVLPAATQTGRGIGEGDPSEIGAGVASGVLGSLGAKSSPLSRSELETEAKNAIVRKMPDAERTIGPGKIAQTFDELADALGENTANAALGKYRTEELNTLDRERRTELERKARNGDRTSAALLLSYKTRDQLADLEQRVTSNGVPDYRAYRQERAIIKGQARAKADEYKDVFDSFEQGSQVQIDALTSRWFSLYDEASNEGGALDENKLIQSREAFRREIGDELYAKVSANASAPDPRDPPLEQRYKRDVQAISDSGFFDLSENIVRDFAAQAGLGDATGVPTLSAVREAVRQGAEQASAQLSRDPTTRNLFVQSTLAKFDGQVGEMIDKRRMAFLAEHPELIEPIQRWQYAFSGKTGLDFRLALEGASR